MEILLINPVSDDDILARVMKEIPCLDSPAFFAPHALVAVAAVTPAGHTVIIHDEYLAGPVDARLGRETFDVIGITLTNNQLRRTLADFNDLESDRLQTACERVLAAFTPPPGAGGPAAIFPGSPPGRLCPRDSRRAGPLRARGSRRLGGHGGAGRVMCDRRRLPAKERPLKMNDP